MKYAHLPDGNAAGVFGDEDVLGCLNRLNDRQVRGAAQLVERGDVYSLNAPLDWPSPALFGRGNLVHHLLDTPRGNYDEYVDNFYPQSSSQWDGFIHVRSATRRDLYNGRPREDLGIETWARRGIVGRGVLLDVARWRREQGRPVHWLHRDVITADELEQCRAAQGTRVEDGDILLIRTGWVAGYEAASESERRIVQDPSDFISPGLSASTATAALLWNWRIAAVGADNPALEAWPFDEPSLHDLLLPNLGLPIGELWWMEDLADACATDGVHEFMFTAAPWHLVGGVGSPANALAIR